MTLPLCVELPVNELVALLVNDKEADAEELLLGDSEGLLDSDKLDVGVSLAVIDVDKLPLAEGDGEAE